MRNLKRALSLALASVMLLGMMVVGTSAASFTDVDSSNNVEAIEVLKAVGVMNGYDDGGFHPDANVTRNQMAMIICSLLGLDGEDFKDYRPFDDVPEWAVGAVGACEANGIVGGRGNRIYDGDAYVTGVEAAAMMLRALGYTEMAASASWETPIVQKAQEIKLFKDVSKGSGNAYLNRNDVAQLTLNALKADVVNTVTSGTVTTPDGTVVNLGEIRYNKVEVNEKGYTNDADTDSNDYKYQQLCEKLYGTDLKLDTGDEDKLGRPAQTWSYKGVGDVVTVAKEADYTVVLKETPDDDDDLLDQAKKNLEKDTGFKIVLNGDEAATYNALGAGDIAEYHMDADDSKKVETIYVTRYTLDKIDDIDTDVSDDDKDDGVSCYVDFADGESGVNNTDIPGFNASTYVKDAYVALLISDDGTIVDSYIVDSVEDSVETVKGETEVTIGKTKYTAAAGIAADGDYVDVDEVVPGTDNVYTLYLDSNGYVLGIVKVEGEDATIDDVYYLDTVWKNQNGKSNTYYAQLVSLDGTVRDNVQLETEDHDLPSSKNDLSNGTDYSDYTALNGLLVTISDKKDENSKANNDKYNLKVWAPAEDWDSNKIATSLTDLKKDSRTVKADSTDTYRLNASTVYLFLEKSGDDLAVSRYVGGVAFAGAGVTATKSYIITEKDETLAKYVVIATDDASQTVEFNSDVIFIKEASQSKGDGYINQTVYLPNGREETWKIDNSEYTISGSSVSFNGLTVPGFFTYGENDDGFYELDTPDEMSVSGAVANVLDWQDDKPEGVLLGVTFGSNYDLFEGLLTVNDGTNDIVDITVSGDYKDLHKKDGAGQYNKVTSRLEDLAQAMKDKKAGTATLYMNVSKDGVVTIFVTDVTVYEAPATCDHATLVQGTEGKTGAQAATCTQAGNPDYWTCPVCHKYLISDGTASGTAPVIDATGHTQTFTYDNASDPHTHSATACSVCNEQSTAVTNEQCTDGGDGNCAKCGNSMS